MQIFLRTQEQQPKIHFFAQYTTELEPKVLCHMQKASFT